MPAIPTHWTHPPDLRAARAAQEEMAAAVIREDAFGPVTRLGAADTSAQRFDPQRRIYAALVTLDGPRIAAATHADTARFPYVPGYLGFREIPALLEAWTQLTPKPDLILVDGHGLAHPRGMGIATQLGLVLDMPTIGVAKSLLVGTLAAPLGPAPGDQAPLLHKDQLIGMALRTRRNANPLYISIGHRISLPTAIAWVRQTTGPYRLPAPIRAAHDAANTLRRASLAAHEACA